MQNLAESERLLLKRLHISLTLACLKKRSSLHLFFTFVFSHPHPCAGQGLSIQPSSSLIDTWFIKGYHKLEIMWLLTVYKFTSSRNFRSRVALIIKITSESQTLGSSTAFGVQDLQILKRCKLISRRWVLYFDSIDWGTDGIIVYGIQLTTLCYSDDPLIAAKNLHTWAEC